MKGILWKDTGAQGLMPFNSSSVSVAVAQAAVMKHSRYGRPIWPKTILLALLAWLVVLMMLLSVAHAGTSSSNTSGNASGNSGNGGTPTECGRLKPKPTLESNNTGLQGLMNSLSNQNNGNGSGKGNSGSSGQSLGGNGNGNGSGSAASGNTFVSPVAPRPCINLRKPVAPRPR